MADVVGKRFDLTGRLALVTGASSGLGARFARTLAEAGAAVILAARRKERLEALAEELRGEGVKALAVSMDVTDAASIEAARDAVEAEFGRPADIVVNNSGVSRGGWLVDMSEDDYDLVMDTNVKGVWMVTKYFAGAMMKASIPGSIVNIASITGRRPNKATAIYATSKAACEHLTRCMAEEMGRSKIRVNAIAPGYFNSEMTGDYLESPKGKEMMNRSVMRRPGEADELSGALLLLTSDAGSYMTGATIEVDGGHLIYAI
ncbi:MAG: glucose 1-dehydrogenase [Pseudomonadota bacterium]